MHLVSVISQQFRTSPRMGASPHRPLPRFGATPQTPQALGQAICQRLLSGRNSLDLETTLLEFLAAGADLSVKSSGGDTVLELLASKAPEGVIEHLLKQKQVFPSKALAMLICRRNPQWIDQALANGSPVTPLALKSALVTSQADLFQTLWEQYQPQEPKDINRLIMGKSAVMWALHSVSLEPLKRVLAMGANPNVPSKDDCLPLWQAAESGLYRAAELLVVAKAEINPVYEGQTPLDVATQLYQSVDDPDTRHRFYQLRDLLKSHGGVRASKPWPLSFQAAFNSLAAMLSCGSTQRRSTAE